MSDLPQKGTLSLVIIISDSLIVASRILRLAVSFYSKGTMGKVVAEVVVAEAEAEVVEVTEVVEVEVAEAEAEVVGIMVALRRMGMETVLHAKIAEVEERERVLETQVQLELQVVRVHEDAPLGAQERPQERVDAVVEVGVAEVQPAVVEEAHPVVEEMVVEITVE